MDLMLTPGGRVFDTRTGRFLSRDPSVAGGMNRYAGLRDNPPKYVDPEGSAEAPVDPQPAKPEQPKGEPPKPKPEPPKPKPEPPEPEPQRPKDISRKGLEFMKQWEGKVKVGDKHVPYDDQTGKPTGNYVKGATVGHGHLIRNAAEFEKYCRGISDKEATGLFKADVKAAVNDVKKCITADINQNQFDALTSLRYNIGSTAFKNSSIRKMINDPSHRSKLYKSQEEAFKAWKKSQGKVSKGLMNRREAEWKLFTR